MATINIRRDVSDPFYRYKMEKIQSKIEGKGNGIKTVIVNLSSIANSLARPGAYVIKYFGFELGAQTNSNPADDRWIINGAHEASKLQDYLDGFITKFVLCKKCKNPETETIIKDGFINLECKACGQTSSVDLRLKLCGFILKIVPKKGKMDKADRRAARKAKQNGKADENGSPDDDDEGSNEKEDAASDEAEEEGVKKAYVDARDTFEQTAADLPSENREVRDDEWAVDMSENAVKARAQQLSDDLKKNLVIGDDDDEDGEGGDSAYDQLGQWILEQTEEKGSVDKVDAIEVYVKAKELGIEGKHKTLLVLAQTLFNDSIVSQIPKRAGLLKNMITSDRHEKAFLGGIERFIGLRIKENAEIVNKVSPILMQAYNEDLISEDVVTKWCTRASKKYVDLATSKKVRKSAEKFVEWLAAAESGDESEESDDE